MKYLNYMGPWPCDNHPYIIQGLFPPNFYETNNFNTVFKVDPSWSNFKFKWHQLYFSSFRLFLVLEIMS